MRSAIASALALALVAACGGAPPPAPPPPRPAPVAALPPTPAAPPRATFPGVPATPVGDQLAWLLDAIVHHQGAVAPADVEARFAPSFLANVPTGQLIGVFAQVGAKAQDLVVTGATGDDRRLVAKITVHGAKQLIKIAVDETGKIAGLLFTADVTDLPATYEAAEAQLTALAPHAQFLVAALDKGACKPLRGHDSKAELGIGSAFKLYVLLGLADKLIAGTQQWTDELAVRDDWKSLPSGITQNDPAGTKLTVQTLAERMISISDNTATDHLLYTVGRKQVEAAVREAKHARPALDTPFLGTRELFVLKLGPDADALKYIAAGEAARRKTLDVTFAGVAPSLASAASWKTARHIDKLEWFASSEDLCRAMGALWTRAQNPKAAEVLGVLAKNPGLPVDKALWPYVGFKGGSEPGVLELTFLLRRADDRWFVVTVAANTDEGGAVEEDKLFPVALGLIQLANKEP